MARTVKLLSSEDWERAALEAIAEGGLQGVAVEPLARRLGVTKGSFYAHFPDRSALIDAALARWEQVHVEAFVASLDREAEPIDKLRSLISAAVAAVGTRTIQGRLLLESDDARVRAALKRVTELRLLRLEKIFGDLGHPAKPASRRAMVAYAAYIGLLQLAREVPERLGDEEALVKDLVEMLGHT